MRMDNEIIWVDEGFALPDEGHLVQTSFVDLRKPEDRLPITSLVRSCERRYALEQGEILLVSKPTRFQQYGEELILDPQEGLAKEETVIETKGTAADISRQRVSADLDEAVCLLNSPFRVSHTETHTNTNSQTLTYENDWWIFCTAIKPNDHDWGKWRSTLPQEYDHVSEIGQPAKFAQALAPIHRKDECRGGLKG